MNGADTVVDRPVRIRDNGIRSFLPPTFCFELRDDAGVLVEAVSQLRMESLDDFDVLDRLTRRRLRATGAVADYDAGPDARVPGRRFTIQRLIDDLGNDIPLGGI